MDKTSRYGPMLDALRGLAWSARRSVRSAAPGTHRSPLRGVSPEFTEYRPYRQGDDPRRLDWKLLARTDRASVRVTRDQSTFATMMLVDASASMAFPKETLAKWEMACRVAIGLAAVALAAGDPVGFLVTGAGGLRPLAPSSRRGVITDAAGLLAAAVPEGAAPLSPALGFVRPEWRVAIISDFLGDTDHLLQAARERLGAGGEVHAVHVVAREELGPGAGAMLATDPEEPRIRRPLGPANMEEYQSAFELWRGEMAREWRDAGAGYTQVATDEPAERAVRRIVEPSASRG